MKFKWTIFNQLSRKYNVHKAVLTLYLSHFAYHSIALTAVKNNLFMETVSHDTELML